MLAQRKPGFWNRIYLVEIIRGLQVGDKVILSDMTPFASVERVRIK